MQHLTDWDVDPHIAGNVWNSWDVSLHIAGNVWICEIEIRGLISFKFQGCENGQEIVLWTHQLMYKTYWSALYNI